MSTVPGNLSYTKSHEWIRPMDDGTVLVGISDHAQELLGDVVYIDVPPVGKHFQAGEACAVIESVKAAADVYCPVSGEVVEANAALGDSPEQVNQDSYGAGWLMRIKPDNSADLAALLDATAYSEFVAADAH